MGSICTPSESNKTIVLGRYLLRPSLTEYLTTTHHTTPHHTEPTPTNGPILPDLGNLAPPAPSYLPSKVR
jgi:hypothetical protein